MFGLKLQELEALNRCFARYPLIERVILYGSRAKGNFKNGSDVDLTIVGDLDFSGLLQLENEIDDLMLPYKVDISLYRQLTNADLLEHIERVGKLVYQRTTENFYPA
jgi:uncharacterized protein